MEPQSYYRQINESVKFLSKNFGKAPDMALVLGSGVGGEFLKKFPQRANFPYKKIPNFPESTVEGHCGALSLYRPPGKTGASLVILEGRCHFYEGHSPEDLIFPYRVLAKWGVPRVLLTNACGSINPRLKTGSWVLIRDHINLMGINPLRGPNLDELGPRFPSLNNLYRGELSKKIIQSAKKLKIKLGRGIYVGVAGPSYETQAELKAFRKWGGDIIGMSTVPEAIASHHAGMDVAALGVVTNLALGGVGEPNHREVLENARKADQKLAILLQDFIEKGFK